MLNQTQLAAMLSSVNVEDLAREAGVSTKTIYRLRHQQHSPTLNTVQAIVDAVKKLKAKKPRKVAA
jgi:DNA-binding phage protein